MNWRKRKQYDTLLARETGGVQKVWGVGHTVCLAYPHAYAVGMANLGFQTVYAMINKLPFFLCERAFLSVTGGGAESAAGRAEMVSLENRKPLADFDILAFSLSFENDYPAILQMLASAGIPLLADERSDEFPLVIAGGIAPTLNPEPLANFFDAFILGEAEVALPEFLRLFRQASAEGLSRAQMLTLAQKRIPGVYVPGCYDVSYAPDGRIEAITPVTPDLPARLSVSAISEINAFCTTETVSAPDTEMAQMYLVEVNRGCPHLCRFCAAGYVYFPPRFRSYEKIIEAVDEGLLRKNKIGLVGTAVSNHPDLIRIGRYIAAKGAKAGIGSLRADQIDAPMVDLLVEAGIETVALAPEAGSERLRNLLHKGLGEEDILRAARLLIERDIAHLRLYFMVGLPTETDADIDAIIDLAVKIQQEALRHTTGQKKFRRITLSINQFIPKPRTPLQWCPLADVQEVAAKIRRILQAFRRDKQIQVIADTPKHNYVQALLSLGDRRVGEALLAAHAHKGNWTRALKAVKMNFGFYIYREKDEDEILPWDLVEVGVPKERLLSEYRRAIKREGR